MFFIIQLYPYFGVIESNLSVKISSSFSPFPKKKKKKSLLEQQKNLRLNISIKFGLNDEK